MKSNKYLVFEKDKEPYYLDHAPYESPIGTYTRDELTGNWYQLISYTKLPIWNNLNEKDIPPHILGLTLIY